jgi:multidrug efflux pump subunit AcrB
MWIVRLALNRPYTFVILSLLLVLMGIVSVETMPVDVFPYIDLPVLSVIFNYGGISSDEMANRVMTVFERSVASNVNDIEHIESQAYQGVAVIKLFLQPNARVELAQTQVVSTATSSIRQMPPGIFPPNVVKYDASSVPVIQLGLGSKTMSEQDLFDYGNNFLKLGLISIRGTTIPGTAGGKFRGIMIDLDPNGMYSKGISATDVSNALQAQNLILPAGTAKFGDREYQIHMNSSPRVADEMNNLPIKVVNGAVVYMRDVAHVRNGAGVQSAMVRVNGNKGALMSILRNGRASTIEIVKSIKAALPRIMASLPPELEVKELADQSIFVRASIQGVVREAVIAAGLTGLMILLFLGSWRSTVIVCVSIPLSIFASLIIMNLTGQTINVMTLGGMALAVGILVDDATVAIENMHRNMAMKKPLVRAVIDGAEQIATPALVSTLCICVVFVPVLMLNGAARFLFTPLSAAVVYAMLASYVLSRSLVPIMVHRMLRPELKFYMQGEGEAHGGAGLIWAVHNVFNAGFNRMREFYASLLDWSLDHRKMVLAAFMLFSFGSLGLIRFIGSDFFPTVDSGQLRLHARAPAGTRLEETEQIFAKIEEEIRRQIPPAELSTIIDSIGLPAGGNNLAYGDNPTIGVSDGEILISLTEDHKIASADYTTKLRKHLNDAFPGVVFFFESANITNQILNFGIPAPIDLQIATRNADAGYKLAQQLSKKLEKIPGIADVHVHQVVDYPAIQVDVDRSKASAIGLTQRDVSNSLLISLSGSGSVAPTQWLNWATGVNYNVNVQTPQYRVDSMDAMMHTPILPLANFNNRTADSPMGTSNNQVNSVGLGPNQQTLAYGNPGAVQAGAQFLSNLAETRRTIAPQIVNHYDVQPVFDVFANVDHQDLGSVGTAVKKVMDETAAKLPKTINLQLRGQVATMQDAFYRLGLGLVFSIILVYSLMVLNFQSWLDPFIILMALPGALAGIVWIMFLTQTTFSVPSMMGAIMCIGVATANSILLVTFANDQRLEGLDERAAALSAGYTRIRPVLMTATAMIIGMVPMALGLGEGGEQNAPLGRAVIGGLAMATFTTLFAVPIVYSLLRKRPPVNIEARLAEEERGDAGSLMESEA